jgi:WD40 repeat protein
VPTIARLSSKNPTAAFLNVAVFSPDDEFILTGEGWPTFAARLWDSKTGQLLRSFTGHKWSVDSVAFDATGTCILTGSDAVRLWSIADLAAQLEAAAKPNGLELRWRTGILQRSYNVNGPWESTGFTSPCVMPSDAPAAFFRVSIPAHTAD